ncbi:MAG TPA: hypothetical protein VH722_12645 [Alphaproteobacteria bacterium]|jgi:hypothetical protein|nr:hypothetical protein [Alphaproteobacteria bacterium]
MRFLAALSLAVALLLTGGTMAAPVDGIADALVNAANKPEITATSLPDDFARMSRFVRRDTGGMAIFSDGGPTDGYVRHAQARVALSSQGDTTGLVFMVAFELAVQPDFTFEGLSAALEGRLGTPTSSANQIGNVFRTWRLKQVDGRTLTIAKSQASDNGDPVTVVSLTQKK